MSHGSDSKPRSVPTEPALEQSRRLEGSDRPWWLDDLPIAVLILHGDDVVAVKEQWTALTGLDLTASRLGGWLKAVRREDRPAVRAFVSQALSGNDAVADWRLAGPGGRGLVWVQANARHVDGTDRRACLMTLTEITAHPSPGKLLHQATHDALTGLLNRAAFIAEVQDALQRAAPAPMLAAVLFIDLDRFKEVNDRLGHQAGDTLLAVACRRIETSLRATECAGRLGGDEFGVLCPALDSRNSALRLAERLVATLEQPFTIHDDVVLIGASIGVAFSDTDSLNAVELVNDADRAMYRAKADGRARCAVFASGDEQNPSEPEHNEVLMSLAHIAVSVARGERQVNDLWRHSIDLRDDTLTQRLSRASQALRSANMALREDLSIG